MLATFRRLLLLSACALFCVGPVAAWAQSNHDRTQVGRNISIGAHEEASDATCFGCSIRVRGHVAGDVTAFDGSIVIEDEGQVDGDATTFGGGIRLENEVKVKGDVTVFGGRIQRDPGAAIGGDVTTMGGPGWVLLILVAPFVILGFFVALILWGIRRMLRPSMPAAA
jgi:cytoskeletal protein CcmA (bactofilin family)